MNIGGYLDGKGMIISTLNVFILCVLFIIVLIITTFSSYSVTLSLSLSPSSLLRQSLHSSFLFSSLDGVRSLHLPSHSRCNLHQVHPAIHSQNAPWEVRGRRGEGGGGVWMVLSQMGNIPGSDPLSYVPCQDSSSNEERGRGRGEDRRGREERGMLPCEGRRRR